MIIDTVVESRVLALLDDMATRLDQPAKARQDHAKELASIICDAIRSGEATGTVVTTGSATTQQAVVKLPIK